MYNLFTFLEYSNYYGNLYAVGPLVVTALAFILGIILYLVDRKSFLHRQLFLVFLMLGLWQAGLVLLFSARPVYLAFVGSRIMFIGMVLTAAALFHLSSCLTGREDDQRKGIFSVYTFALFLGVLNLSTVFYKSLAHYSYGLYPNAGVFLFLPVVFTGFCFLCSMVNLIKYYYHQKQKPVFKLRLWYLYFFCVLCAYVDFVTNFQPFIYPAGFLPIFGFIAAVFLTLIQRENRHSVDKSRELEAVEREVQKLRARVFEMGRLSAVASLNAGILHQISQPVTALHGFVRFLKKNMDVKDPLAAPVTLMEGQTTYMKNMLADLMDLIRHQELNIENLNVNQTLQKTIALIIDELRIRRVHWDLRCADDLPEVPAVEVHLQQIFLNIMINAVQALAQKQGQRLLTITTHFDKNRKEVSVSFLDNGPGLTDEQKEHLFEPFYSTKTHGTGMGLALCRDILDEIGGRLDVESSPGQGAAFTIALPTASHQKG